MTFLNHATLGVNSFRSYVISLLFIFAGFVIIGQLPFLIEFAFNKNFREFSGNSDLYINLASLDKNKLLVYLLFPFFGALGALFIAIKYVHKRPIKSLFTTRNKFHWGRFFISFLIWGFVLSVFLTLSWIIDKEISWNFNPKTFVPLLLISLFLIPVQTTCEEVFFRAYLLQSLGRSWGRGWLSIVGSGILFGLMHISNPEVEVLGYSVLIYFIFSGFFLGLIAVMDDGLELTMGYHAVNNIFGALIVTNNWQAFQTDSIFIDHSKPMIGWDIVLTLVIIQPLLIWFYSKLFSWKDWNERLLINQRSSITTNSNQ